MTEGNAIERTSSPERRFFAEILPGAMTLKADRILLREDHKVLSVVFVKSREEIFSKKFPLISLANVTAWLDARITVLSDLDASGALIRIGNDAYSVRIAKASRLGGGESISLSEFRKTDIAETFKRLGDERLQRMLQDSGTLLVAIPSTPARAMTEAAILAVSLRERSTESNAAAGQKLFIVSASDPVNALKRSPQLFSTNVKVTVVCLLFVPHVCQSCGKSAPVSPELLDHLPPLLRPHSTEGYHIGRGCDRCGHTGYLGYIPIMSVVECDQKVRELVAAGNWAEVARYLFSHGGHPLIHDAMQKAFTGQTTLEALGDMIKTVPPEYRGIYSHMNQAAAGPIVPVKKLAEPVTNDADDEILLINDSFFTTKSEVVAPLRGRASFTGDVADQDPRNYQSTKRVHPLILVVEDDLEQQNVLELVLRTAHYEVRCVDNGALAFSEIKKDLPDIIVTDLMMPTMDGGELVGLLKSHHLYKKIPVLVLTAISDSEKEYELLDLGADDYCEKTVPRKILLKRIDNLLRRSFVTQTSF